MQTTLDVPTTVTSDSGQQNATAAVGVSDQTLKPTYVSTGLTNSAFLDSFFLPLMVALVGVWLYKQGFIGVPKWARMIQVGNKEERAQKELQRKISQIHQEEVSK